MCTGAHAFIPGAELVRAELRLQQDNQRVENVLWFDVQEPPSADDVTGVADVVSSWWIAHIKPVISDSVRGLEVVATAWDNEEGYQVTDTAIAGLPGDVGATALPNAVSIAVHLNTVQRGRSNQGHIMHVGLTENQTSGNNLLPAYAAGLLIAYNELISSALAAGYLLCVASFCSQNMWRTAAHVAIVESATFRDTVLDQAIRRKPGHGR